MHKIVKNGELYDFDEPCPHCGEYNSIRIDYSCRDITHGYKCAHCGKELKLCTICALCPNNCDWHYTNPNYPDDAGICTGYFDNSDEERND